MESIIKISFGDDFKAPKFSSQGLEKKKEEVILKEEPKKEDIHFHLDNFFNAKQGSYIRKKENFYLDNETHKRIAEASIVQLENIISNRITFRSVPIVNRKSGVYMWMDNKTWPFFKMMLTQSVAPDETKSSVSPTVDGIGKIYSITSFLSWKGEKRLLLPKLSHDFWWLREEKGNLNEMYREVVSSLSLEYIWATHKLNIFFEYKIYKFVGIDWIQIA